MFYFRKIAILCSLSLVLLILNGCQMLSGSLLNSNESAPDTETATNKANFLEPHHFDVDYEQNVIGTLATLETQESDTLPDIARHFGLGHNEIVTANPQVDLWLPTPGTRLLLPTQFTLPDAPRNGIVLNLANMRLFYFPAEQPEKVMTYPVGIGREGWLTPTGLTKIVSKTKNPVWHVPESIRKEHADNGDPLPEAVQPGIDNPLGEYAMRLASGSYFIHGTNKPYGVGMQVSHGCLNLYPEDIKELFQNTQVGTPVMIVDQPYLLGWHQGMLFVEAHKPLQNKDFKKLLLARIKKFADYYQVTVDWQRVKTILQQTNGIPTPILAQSVDFQYLSATALALEHPENLLYVPPTPNITPQDWSIRVDTFKDANLARKMVLMLTHQGPTIPASLISQANQFVVFAGPFANKQQSENILARIKNNFGIVGKINSPKGVATAKAVKKAAVVAKPSKTVPVKNLAKDPIFLQESRKI